MREIPLSGAHSNLATIVNDEDFLLASAHRWYRIVKGHNVYAIRTFRFDGIQKTLGLHTFLTGWPLADHVNHNGLDNRRENLRPATPGQNSMNARKPRTCGDRGGLVSQFKGVSVTPYGRWYTRIKVNGQQLYLGSYRTEHEAADAYDCAALEHFGEFAVLNLAGGKP